MKTDLNYLPANKQSELFTIVDIIKAAVPAEMIILFGSYARNNWVEDKYDEEHYRYQSDFDILVIVEMKSEVQLIHQVEALKDISKSICIEKINSY